MRRLNARRRAGGVRMLAFAWLMLAVMGSEGRAAEDAHQPHAVVHAVRTVRPPAVDGRLTEEGWLLAETSISIRCTTT